MSLNKYRCCGEQWQRDSNTIFQDTCHLCGSEVEPYETIWDEPSSRKFKLLSESKKKLAIKMLVAALRNSLNDDDDFLYSELKKHCRFELDEDGHIKNDQDGRIYISTEIDIKKFQFANTINVIRKPQ